MKRKPLSNKTSRRIFRKGSKVNGKNSLHGRVVMRGGIRL